MNWKVTWKSRYQFALHLELPRIANTGISKNETDFLYRAKDMQIPFSYLASFGVDRLKISYFGNNSPMDDFMREVDLLR